MLTASPTARWGWLALLVVLACAGVLRLRQAARVEVVGDEMLHLPSYRNHYGTSDVYPVFRARLDQPGGLPARIKPWLRDYYERGPLAQRSLLIAMDGHPPLHPLLLEVSQALTYDSLAVPRAASLLASLGAILLAYRLGRELGDVTVGLLLAAMLAVSVFPVTFGGVARSYAFIEPALLFFLASAARACRRGRFVSWATLGPALLCQLVHWFVWPVVATCVAGLVVFELRSGTRPRQLLRAGAGYLLASLALLGYFLAQLLNPTLRGAGTLSFDPRHAAELFAGIAPTSWFEFFGGAARAWGGVASLALALLGLRASRRAIPESTVRWACVGLPSLGAGVFLVATPAHGHYLAAAAVPLLLLIALGLRAALGARGATVLALGWALTGAGVHLLTPADRSPITRRQLPGFAASAPVLRAEVARTGRWVSYPYFVANQFYRYVGDLPSPREPQSLQEFVELLREDDPITILMLRSTELPDDLAARMELVHRVDEGTAIYRLGRASRSTSGPAPAPSPEP